MNFWLVKEKNFNRVGKENSNSVKEDLKTKHEKTMKEYSDVLVKQYSDFLAEYTKSDLSFNVFVLLQEKEYFNILFDFDCRSSDLNISLFLKVIKQEYSFNYFKNEFMFLSNKSEEFSFYLIDKNIVNSKLMFKILKNIDNIFVKDLAYFNKDIELLEYLSKSNDVGIRWLVAKNENTPSYILEKLSKDNTSHNVRIGVASNKNTSEKSLLSLILDKNTKVSKTALETYKSLNLNNEDYMYSKSKPQFNKNNYKFWK